jgi:tetratricopeptide (TPR) repeat protein
MGIMEGVYARNHGLISMKAARNVENHGLLIALALLTLAGVVWQEGIRPLKGEVEHLKYKKAYVRKDYGDAERHLRRALEHDPEHTAYHLYACQLYYNHDAVRDYAKSLAHAEQAIAHFNGCMPLWTAYHAIGLVKYKTGVLLEAKLAFEKALYYNPNFPEAARKLDDVNEVMARYVSESDSDASTH